MASGTRSRKWTCGTSFATCTGIATDLLGALCTLLYLVCRGVSQCHRPAADATDAGGYGRKFTWQAGCLTPVHNDPRPISNRKQFTERPGTDGLQACSRLRTHAKIDKVQYAYTTYMCSVMYIYTTTAPYFFSTKQKSVAWHDTLHTLILGKVSSDHVRSRQIFVYLTPYRL
jgi:hypothetical protein